MQRRRRTNPIQIGDRVVVVQGQLRGLEGIVTAREQDGRVAIQGVLNQEGLSLRIPGRCVRPVEQRARTTGDQGSV